MLTIFILFTTLFPIFIIYLTERYSIFNKIGAVVLAYLIGILIGNLGILPENIGSVQELINTITVPLALPLLLFSMNVRAWSKMLGKVMLSFAIALVSLLIMVVIGFFLFSEQLDDAWKIGGMLVGVYTGGTPNLASIKAALQVDHEVYIMTHAYDTLISAIYILFLITVGQRFFLLFLPAFKSNKQSKEQADALENDSYLPLIQKENLLPLAKAFGFAVLALAIGGGISMLVPESASTAVAILLITTLGIVFSLIPSVNKIKYTFHLGMYFILVFSLNVASMADISKFVNISVDLFYYISFVVMGSFLMHSFFSKLAKIDADTFMITSTAMINSPAFVPLIADSIKNKEVIVSGLTVGIIGYAIGNYIGVGLAYILQTF